MTVDLNDCHWFELSSSTIFPGTQPLLLGCQAPQPLDEHLRPLGTGEVVFHSGGDEVADAVAAFFMEIKAGGDAELFQIGDDVGGNLDGLVGGGVDEKNGR